MRWMLTWTAAGTVALGSQRHGERRRLTGGGWYREVEGDTGISRVCSLVLKDERGGRRRGRSGGEASGLTATALERCSGETKVTRRKPSLLRCRRCGRRGSGGSGCVRIARRSRGGEMGSSGSYGG